MPKVKEETVTDIKLGEFYEISPVTLTRWKKSGNEKLYSRYKAFKRYYAHVQIMNSTL